MRRAARVCRAIASRPPVSATEYVHGVCSVGGSPRKALVAALELFHVRVMTELSRGDRNPTVESAEHAGHIPLARGASTRGHASAESSPMSASAASPSAAAAAAPTVLRAATARVVLGRSGVTVPRLAMGTGSNGWARQSDQTRLGEREFVRLMRHGHERGASFIDAADLYGSHPLVKASWREIDRDEVVLLTKIWFSEAPRMTPTSTARPEVERFRRELGVDRLDIVLIHCVTDPAWPSLQSRMRDELSELKAAGIVRAVGCSCHSHAALRVAAEDPWVDVIFARINPGHKRMDSDANVEQVAATLKLARANGKGVVGMKIYGAGDLQSPEQRRKSLEYVLHGGFVDALTIGHTSAEQVDDTLANIEAVLRAAPTSAPARGTATAAG
jgi:aryl-alcohol dehydrogenase-like predicted oxidoreductase